MKLTLDKIFSRLQSKWKRIGQLIVQQIPKDAQKGIFQTPTGASNKPNYNRKYAKYKANYMERFTDTKNGKRGQKIKKYYGTSVKSNQTSRVDMTVTGDLFERLHVQDYLPNGVIIAYRSSKETIAKILGANYYERRVVGLNDKNINMVKDELVKGLSEELKKELKDININIKL